jgi:hypothetical protein
MVAIRPLGDWSAAEVKIGVIGIAIRPAASLFGEREDFFGGGRAWGLFRRPQAEIAFEDDSVPVAVRRLQASQSRQ